MNTLETPFEQHVAARGRRALALAATGAVAAAVAVAVFIDGGFSPEVRGAFAALAGVAALLAISLQPTRALAAARSAPVLCLLALAVVTAVSAAWTIGEPVRAFRWSLVVAAYAAVAIAAAAASGRTARWLLAGIACTAVIAGVVGLAGVAARHSPIALHLGGEWQAAGPFQYPPALAWLEAAAIPILLTAGVRGGRGVSLAASAGLAIATMAIALSASRVGYALAIGLLALAILDPGQTTRTARAPVAWLVAAACALPTAILAVVDLGNPDSAIAGTAWRSIVLLGIVLLSLLLWGWRGPGNGSASQAPSPKKPTPALRIGILAAAVVLALGVSVFAERSGPGVERVQDWSHGRVAQWEAAAQTIADHPLAGSGGEAYFRGARAHQGADPSLYAHDLPLEVTAELGIVGAILVITLYGAVFRLTWRVRRAPVAWLAGPAAVLFLAANLVDWPWHLAGAGAVWAVAVGLLVGQAGVETSSENLL